MAEYSEPVIIHDATTPGLSQMVIDNGVSHIQLREWTEGESNNYKSFSERGAEYGYKLMTLRQTTVAYGIAELLKQARLWCHSDLALPPISLSEHFNIDNFIVRVNSTAPTSHPCSDIEGVDMLKPRLSVNIIEPSFLREEYNRELICKLGRYVEAEFPFGITPVFINQSEEDYRCHMFGVLMYELFLQSSEVITGRDVAFLVNGGSALSAMSVSDVSGGDNESKKPAARNFDASLDPARNKTLQNDLRDADAVAKSHKTVSDNSILNDVRQERYEACATAVEKGFPSSLCLVIQNLLDCGVDGNRPDNAYDSLEAVTKELHLLLLDPERFLFDNDPAYHDTNGQVLLSFRENTLYGRETEEFMITDAFCRVSGGKCESLFIGGFSGSGKSRLMNKLTDQVDAIGGYVLSHKFDQILPKERSLLEIVALFNGLCLLIIEKNTKPDVLALVDDLIGFFGPDLSSLARLLPNIKVLASHLNLHVVEQESDSQTNVRSICFTLQRFIGVVSSAAHPVVLFLDDLQWCDDSVLTVVESIFNDASKSNCLFFVGTYRSNEVADDHEIFRSAKRLKSSGVPTTMMSLEGLQPNDLNTMVSDALCVFPRICEPLSDIVFQKTKGNPFFVLAFLRSLADRGLLKYCVNARRWLWDEDDVSSMDVTGNVLQLLSFKMSGLSLSIRSALKTAACFGINIDQDVITTLAANPEHADIQNLLEEVVREGFMVKVGSTHYRFVHDKVREAAYSLIPDEERDQYHYNIGKSLYLTSKGKDLEDEMLLFTADQMMHRIVDMEDECPELRIDISNLYYLSGMKAMGYSDYAKSCSYFKVALSLLPTNCWESQYKLCHRISLKLAKSVYSLGDVEEAQSILHEMLEKCSSIEDRLPVQALLVTIHISSKRFMIAYAIGREVLSQLGEDIPETLSSHQNTTLMTATIEMVKGISDKNLLEMKEMDSKLATSMRFYNLMWRAAYMGKPEMVPFFACRAVQLTMENGMCKHSIAGFLILAALLCSKSVPKKAADIGSNIGKAAMSFLSQRHNTTDQIAETYGIYYGYVAWRTESLQTCTKKLGQGFEVGMSLGESNAAFTNSVCQIRSSILAGDKLPSLLEKVDYYLKLADTYSNDPGKIFFSIFRCTIKIMIGGEDSAHFTGETLSEMAIQRFLEPMHFNSALQAYWQGYYERSQHFVDKMIKVTTKSEMGQLNATYVIFINGLNTFELMKSKVTNQLRFTAMRAIKVIKEASEHSSWNFKNKFQLLEAELRSNEGKDDEAMTSYVESINSAKASGFIHEQGLACELAGKHCKKVGDNSSAQNFFNQAKVCYTEWGSLMRVESITRQLNLLPE